MATRITNQDILDGTITDSDVATTNATFLTLGATPTAAQVRDQTIALTRQMNGAIKLVLGQVDDLTGT